MQPNHSPEEPGRGSHEIRVTSFFVALMRAFDTRIGRHPEEVNRQALGHTEAAERKVK